MLNVAVILFAVAALGGAVLAVRRLRRQELPLSLALVHGVVAAAGLVLVLLAALGGSAAPLARWSLAAFVVAALGGFVLFSFHLRKKELPGGLVIVHALVAVAGFALLVMTVAGA